MIMDLLPAEITIEILSRLPVDLVIECKLVCKTWRSLIDDPIFGDAHAQKHLLLVDHSNSNYDDDDVTTVFFLLTKVQYVHHWNPLSEEFHFGNYNIISNADGKQMGGGFKISKPLNNISHKGFKSWKIIGSSNGLICLSGRKGIYVYNPCTSEYVNLGHPRFKTSPVDHEHYNIYGKGFGYHPYTKEYKVVVIYYNRCEEASVKQQVGEVSVYTLGSVTWTTTEEEALSHTHRRLSCSTPGVLMNGALHWIRPTMDGNYHEIVSFDLAEEKFISNTIVPSVPAAAPSAPNNLVGTYFQLGLLGGCLCITQHNENSSDIWVMNDKDESWTRIFKISQKDDYRECYSFNDHTRPGSYDPIVLLGNHRKILSSGRKTGGIVLCDIKTGDIDYDILPHGYQSHDFLHIMYAAIPFVKSFVSLKTLGEEGAKKMHNDSYRLRIPLEDSLPVP